MDEQGLHGGTNLDEFEELDRLTEGLEHLPRLLGIPEPDGGPTLDPGRRAPLSIRRISQDSAYNPRFGLDESFDDYLRWLEG